MYDDRVKKGAALLDRVRPGWASEIAADSLAMETCDRCVLGQLFGDYYQGWMAALRHLPHTTRYSSEEHGFTVPGDQQDPTLEPMGVIMPRFAALADAWRAEIRARTGAELSA